MSPIPSNSRVITKGIAIFTLVFLVTESVFATPLMTLDAAYRVPSGMEQSPLTEKKISSIEKFLFGSRSPVASNTVFETSKGAFSELSDINSKAYGLALSGSILPDFSGGKALYDGNVAILDLPTTGSGRLTYEAPYYCDTIISSLAKYNKIGNNICLSGYEAFRSAYAANSERTYVDVVKTNEVQNADLSAFSILVFSDITLGKHGEILDSIGAVGREKIRAFVAAGGMVYFSSKSLILADKMELTNAIVDEQTLVKHRANQGKVLLGTGSEFEWSILNAGLYEGASYSTKTGSGYYDYLLGSYYLRSSNDPAVVPIRDFDIRNDGGYYFQDLTTNENSDIDAESATAAFYKPYGKGLVVYNGGNSLFSPQLGSHILFRNHTLNAFLLSYAREVHASAKVIQKSNPELTERLVPSLEKDILLEYDFHSMNVFTENVSDASVTITLGAAGIAFSDALPSGCVLAEWSGSVTCTKGTISAGEKWDVILNIRVNEPTFTQAGNGIVVTRTELRYTNPKGTPVVQNLSKQTIDALESAKLRASLNIDPPGFYPLKWEGVYVDQILNVNNTAPTEANEVNYTVTVPMISPLFDESDQSLLASKIVFSKSYYDRLRNEATKTGLYPFKNEGTCAVSDLTSEGRCQDFVISSELGSGNVLVDNYDEGVVRKKTDSTEALANISAAGLVNPIGEKILKQTFVPDADKLFLHASPRQMVFEVPAKKELLFARQDVYFYNNPAFPLPHGVTGRSQFISIDASGIGCSKVSGFYDQNHGVVAGKYPNALSCGTSTKLAWTNDRIDFNNLPAGLEKTEYLYPIDPKNHITSASDLEGFDVNGTYVGQKDDAGNTSETYPISYTQGAYATFDLPARSTPKGWYLEITLPEGINPTSAYVSADHIAITKTEVSGNVVRAYFYRGKMPNEQSLKSVIGVALEGITTSIPGQVIKVFSLSYNLSGDPINQYKEERMLLVDFGVLGFLKLPAVKLAFDLPRRKRVSETMVNTLGLSDIQKAAVFTRPEYYDRSYVFAKNDTGSLVSLATKAGLSDTQKTALLELFGALNYESYIRKWENLEPMVRFGTYIQELAFHRTIWGPAEDHPISDPGIMADRDMIANVGNVGISPIPFSEYMTTGISQIIPLAHENGRVNYHDIFGREFATPIRSTIPESVPLPPPVKDFMMNTTYEMYDKDGNRHDFWDGEEELEIRANIKLSNNYPKYFDPTKCANNPSSANYGSCYDGSGSVTTGYGGQSSYILSDKTLDATDFLWTSQVQLFPTKKASDDFLAAINVQLTASGITDYTVRTLHTAKNGVDGVSLGASENINDRARNYSPEVERYYPEGYISNSMWNLTHLDYDDNVFSKGYPYHMDNLLPNPSTTIQLPHNMVAFPVARGSSYKHKYFSEDPWYLQYETQNTGKVEHNFHPYTSWKYPTKTGWWSENLQNRDNTLLSGQSSSNEIPYQKNGNEYLKPSLLDTNAFSSTINTNIYQCLFNPEQLNASDSMLAYGPNTLKNNVIPIIPWITKNTSDAAKYLSQYPCGGTPYHADNLSRVNNVVETESAFWLYFASNLRGEAKESLDVVSRLTAFAGKNYEGDTKVVEGGRFTYWNPAFGPNSFQIVDNPVSIVKTINSSLSLEKELLPYSLKTTSTDAYLLYTIKDPGELQLDANGKETPRKWNDETYTDSRGNGNYGANIVVGDTLNGSAEKSMLAPGETTLVRLDIYNNSGYNWAMLGNGSVVNDNGQFKTYISGGIDFVIDGSNEVLNANDLLSKITRNVVKPTAYNFLDISIPEELKPYVTVTPSAANIRTPGTFSDFDFVNVTTIRDGFKGSYFLDVKLSPDTPESLRGRVHEISLGLKKEYFDRIPGGNDPVGWNELPSLPTMKFAIKNVDGNAFYRSGYSTGITLDFEYGSGFTIDSATEISEDGELALRMAAGDGTNKHRRLRETMESLSASGYALHSFTPSVTTSGSGSIGTITLSQGGISEFPYINASGAIIPKTRILVHLKRNELSDGEHVVESMSNLAYSNFVGKPKAATSSGVLVGYAQWPKLDISYKTVVTDDALGELEIQKLIEGSNTIEAKLFLKNIGTDVAFNPTIRLKVADGVTIRNEFLSGAVISGNTIEIKNFLSESGTTLSGTEGEAVGPGITNFFPVYLSYSGSLSPTPITLIEEASYEFTPYDPILPALTGKSASGALALDFVQVGATAEKASPGALAVSFSGNSAGIYWSATDGLNLIATEEKADEYGQLFHTIQANPLVDHNLHLSAFFRGNSGEFKKIRDIDLAIPKEDPTLSLVSYATQDSTKISAILRTNALPQYDSIYSATLDQSGVVYTGSVNVTSEGEMSAIFDGIDVSESSSIWVDVKDSSGATLAHTSFGVAGAGIQLSNFTATRAGNNVKLTFFTNKVGRSCFVMSRNGEVISPECSVVHNEKINSIDIHNPDIYADAMYSVSLYKDAESFASGATALASSSVIYLSPDPSLSGVKVRIVSPAEAGNTLTFSSPAYFPDPYRIDDTIIQYVARMKSADGEAIEQTLSWKVDVFYSSGVLMYISDGWDKSLDIPKVSTGAVEKDGYQSMVSVIVGDATASIVLDSFARIVINDVWSKPDRVSTVHAGVERDIPECDVNTTVKKECFAYDINKVIITTNKFSSFTLWNKIPAKASVGNGGGGGWVMDSCPNGDLSTSYYDHLCNAPVSATISSPVNTTVPVKVVPSVGTSTKNTTSTVKTKKNIRSYKAGEIMKRGMGYMVIKSGKKNISRKKHILPAK